MKTAVTRKMARAAFLGACTLTFLAGCESDAAAKPSLIPSLAELKPAILCIEAASSESGVRECLNSQGIASDYRFPDQPKSAEDFKQQALITWAVLGRGGTVRLSSRHFDSAIEYATCIEEATNALQGLEGEPKEAIGVGLAKTQLTCADQYLSPPSVAKRHPSMLRGETGNPPEEEMKAFLLGRIFTAAAYRYVIEANGWVVDEMRPCVRYLDGRPPSAGCVGEPEPRAPPPPGPRYTPK